VTGVAIAAFMRKKNSMKNQKKSDFESFIEVEKVFGEFLKELGLKPAQRDLIRVLIIASKGKKIVEISNAELAKLLYKVENVVSKAESDRVAYAIKRLLEWQQENKIALIRVTRRGQRKETEDGKFEYKKPRYRFVLLREIVESLDGDTDSLEAAFGSVLEGIKGKFTVTKAKKPYDPLHLLKKDKKLVVTKIRKIFESAVAADLNPKEECTKVLNRSEKIVEELAQERARDSKKNEFIRHFEEELIA
jgi:hypothetical protein